MSLVTLVSGGLDSTLMALLAHEEGLIQFPLFIDYGQRGRQRELEACQANLRKHGLPAPRVAELRGYGALVPSGLTDESKHVFRDAFSPCRNLFFLTVAAAYAFQSGASTIGIGLLDEVNSIFPDQTKSFLWDAETVLSRSLGKPIRVAAPLMTLTKADVVRIAKEKGIRATYSCHSGTEVPCGACVACREYIGLEA